MRQAFLYLILLSGFLFQCCSSEQDPSPSTPGVKESNAEALTIFFINDQHGQLENFAKLKHIVEEARTEGHVVLACSGDAFSGNPVVDNHAERGYPMIDLMNEVNFDVAVLGNHEFDYGIDILNDRMAQSEFPWICANLDVQASGLAAPPAYVTLQLDEDTRITFLGLVETNGKEGAVIPSTHPWKVQELGFSQYTDVAGSYANLKQDEDADLLVALTHLGTYGDYELAKNFPYFDMIIGGHSHAVVDTVVNNIPVFQSGSYLNYLGRIDLTLEDEKVAELSYELINLNAYPDADEGITQKVTQYTEAAGLEEVIGNALAYHDKGNVGCFFTETLRRQLNTDVSFQNPGGVRAELDAGDINKSEIYAIDPFNNGSLVFTMSVAEIKNFLRQTGDGFFYSGISLSTENGRIVARDLKGDVIPDETVLSVGMNDYIPARYDQHFPAQYEAKPFTTSEALINWLENNPEDIDYSDCTKYFRYNN